MADKATLKKAISNILETSDLNKVSTKKVREQLETELDIDLSDRKKEIDDIVLESLNAMNSDGNSEDEDTGRGKKRKSSEVEAEDKKPKAKGSGQKGFVKTLKLSPQLAAVMGKDEMARHEVVKEMWRVVKEKNLYDPKNRQFAICNDELLPVIGVKRFRIFGMMKFLKKHFITD